ncbi:DUF2793 domain-containing protein [Croceicoccus sp. BE223]|uniref:DUF2793 domain-containing protein n=1 Tax=Croceicoccus sp. BE223 TaxID=2817716 RepID=UPI0028612D1E|nr:DUF2793 domain-containing protein [Croceicoccus sp. BE223]MDR7102801.1 hypothetical protein [Croceicoccus sp. BE223]
MTDPVDFGSITPRFELPLLFAAQAQKEFFVNEAHALVDALLHPVVKGLIESPPPSPIDGESWIIGANSTGAFADRTDQIATLQSGQWCFAKAVEGMTVYDSALAKRRYYRAGWHVAVDVAAPSGGSVQDTQARTSINLIIAALQKAGIVTII